MRYVAIGDSFTEGVGDERPDGSLRGWADRLAVELAAWQGQPIEYANLAIRGRTLRPIVTEQLDHALRLNPAPTMITLNGGGNDMLRPGTDAQQLIALTEAAVRRCLDAGVSAVLLSGADPSQHLPFGKVLRRRGEVLTEAILDLAQRYDLTVVDVFHDAQVRRRVYWSQDRLHLNALGHRRVADLVLVGLGHSGEPFKAPDRHDDHDLWAELRYYGEHVAPWFYRHARGRSSGDGRDCKHADWVAVTATGHAADRSE